MQYKNVKDDLIQVALINMWNGRKYFDKTKSKYSTYAFKICFNSMLDFLYKEFNHCDECISVNITLKTKNNNLILQDCLADTAYCIEDIEDLILIKQVIKKYLKTLNKDSKEYKICKLVLSGVPIMQIKDKIGCSKQYVARVKDRFRVEFKNMLRKEML